MRKKIKVVSKFRSAFGRKGFIPTLHQLSGYAPLKTHQVKEIRWNGQKKNVAAFQNWKIEFFKNSRLVIGWQDFIGSVKEGDGCSQALSYGGGLFFFRGRDLSGTISLNNSRFSREYLLFNTRKRWICFFEPFWNSNFFINFYFQFSSDLCPWHVVGFSSINLFLVHIALYI